MLVAILISPCPEYSTTPSLRKLPLARENLIIRLQCLIFLIMCLFNAHHRATVCKNGQQELALVLSRVLYIFIAYYFAA